MATNWIPTDSDITWTSDLLARLNDQGTWVVPASGCGYRVDKKSKIVTVMFGVIDETHYRICKILASLGYEVVLGPDVEEAPKPTSVDDYMV